MLRHNPSGNCPGLGTNSHYEAPGELQVKIQIKTVINMA